MTATRWPDRIVEAPLLTSAMFKSSSQVVMIPSAFQPREPTWHFCKTSRHTSAPTPGSVVLTLHVRNPCRSSGSTPSRTHTLIDVEMRQERTGCIGLHAGFHSSSPKKSSTQHIEKSIFCLQKNSSKTCCMKLC